MQWYYSQNATQMGPVPLEALVTKLASGEVSGTDMVWREGMPDWRPASAVPELMVISQGNPAVAQSGASVSSPYVPPGAPGAAYVPVRTSGLAIASLVCGISGFFCLLFPGIAAVVCGHMALKDISNSNTRVEGRGMAIAGLVLGYLSVAVLVFWLLAMVISMTASLPH